MPSDQDKVIRKLRAILSDDVKGYTLLMSDDETFTINTLKDYRNIMSEQIDQHDGRVVDSPGDNILAEFASAVYAVTCAVEIQKILKEKNGNFPVDKRLEFRIRVHYTKYCNCASNKTDRWRTCANLACYGKY